MQWSLSAVAGRLPEGGATLPKNHRLVTPELRYATQNTHTYAHTSKKYRIDDTYINVIKLYTFTHTHCTHVRHVRRTASSADDI
jgi:hypothetical protein